MHLTEYAPLRCQPVVIIGAPRSGTNMLRDVLAQLPGVATWPCDEINYIWRHRNARWPTDEIPAGMATSPVRSYIRRAVDRCAARRQASFVVEKTCANSLRVGFVDRVLPEARFVFLVRDGRDTVASARRRWCAGIKPGYLARKARFVPPLDVPYYAVRFLRNRAGQFWSPQRQQQSWGPRFSGLDEMLASRSLEEVCGEQWRQCVVQASNLLRRLPAERVAMVRYEDFVRQPQSHLTRLLQFLGIAYERSWVESATSCVSADHIGKERDLLPSTFAMRFSDVVGETLELVRPLEPRLDSSAPLVA